MEKKKKKKKTLSASFAKQRLVESNKNETGLEHWVAGAKGEKWVSIGGARTSDQLAAASMSAISVVIISTGTDTPYYVRLYEQHGALVPRTRSP